VDAFEPYVHVVAEQGPGSILQPTLMGRAVQNPGQHRVQRALVLYGDVVEAPAPASTVREEKSGADDYKKSLLQFNNVVWGYLDTSTHTHTHTYRIVIQHYFINCLSGVDFQL